MKLRKVKILEYKNLKDIEIDFSRCDGLAVVAGKNGSGKSNLLEALSLIMCEVNGFTASSPSLFYEIDYDCGGQWCHSMRMPTESSDSFVNTEERSSLSGRQKVIAMYCGEFKRLLACGYIGEKYVFPDMIAVVDEDFPIALLTMMIVADDTLSEILQASGVSFDSAIVSYKLRNPVCIGEEGPEDEFEYIFDRLNRVPENEDTGYHEVAFSEFEEIIKVGRDPDARTIYWILSQIMSHSESVTDVYEISVRFTNARDLVFTANDLSEGEKRKIILKAIYEYLADEDSLVLLDEPDAYIHDSQKLDVYDFIEQSIARGVMTVFTTHSALLIDYVKPNHLVIMQKDEKGVEVCQERKIAAITELTDSRMSLFHTKPIILFEGKSDIILLRKAVKHFRENEPGYEALRIDTDFDYYEMGGTGNSEYVYLELCRIFSGRRIYLIFDCDQEGIKAQKKIKCKDGDQALLIPPPEGYTGSTYMIEDYLPTSFIHDCVNEFVRGFSRFHDVVNIKDKLKSRIGDERTSYLPNEYRGFKPLIDFVNALPRK